MQDQGKRLLLAVVLALGVLFLWQVVFPGSKTPPPTNGSGSAAGSAATITLTAREPVDPPGSTCTGSTSKTFDFPMLVNAEFSTCGGTLVGWTLGDPRYINDPSHGELMRKALTPTSKNELGDFALNFEVKDQRVIPPGAQWAITGSTDRTIDFAYDGDGIHAEKHFEIVPAALMVKMTYKSNVSGGRAWLTFYGWQDPKTDTSSSARVQPRVWQSTTYRDGDKVATADVDIGGESGQPRVERHVQYTGFEHPYLMSVFAPKPAQGEAAGDIIKHTRADATGAMRTDIEVTQVSAGMVVGYLGPKNYELLDATDAVAGFDTGFKETMDFGHLPLLGVSLSIIGKPLLWMLGKLFGVVGNWGLAIILLTIIVKVITLFWTTRSMRSMKAMAAVGPQVQEIQKRHGDDKQRAQAETMALYKTHGIRPLAGCAPMFLQIPIWSALYIMLSVTGELYLQPFIPGWINDLTNTDPYYILPIALFGMMFLQARLTPQNAAQPAQKMMQYGMPIMFGVMSFYFPSGLTLYILSNTILSSAHSLYMNRYDKKSLELSAQLKKNKAAAEARTKAEEEALAAAKDAKDTPKNGKSKKTQAPLKVVDVAAVERPTDTTDDGDDNDDEAEAPGAAVGTAGNRPPRSRRKKRRR